MKYLLAVLLISLSGCGFYLRGQQPLPEQLRTLAIQSPSPYSDLSLTLAQALKAKQVTVLSDQQAAPATLELTQDTLQQSLLSVSSSTQVRQFLLTKTIEFQVRSQDNQLIIKPQTLSTTRKLTVDSNQLLGSDEQKHKIEHEMNQTLVMMLMNKLIHLKLTT